MKIAVTGKGGVGKTSIAASLADFYSGKLSVLGVDADPSLNMASLFGLEDTTPLSEMKELVNRAKLSNGLVRMNPKVDDIVDNYAVNLKDNLRLLVVGTVSNAGAGCLCPENALLRSILQELVLSEGVVVLDMEAGLEPMSRGTIKNIDVILVVTEPSTNSIKVAKRIIKLSNELGIEHCFVVGNKIRKDESEFLSKELELFHEIPFDDEFRQKLMGNVLAENTKFYESVTSLGKKVLECVKVGS